MEQVPISVEILKHKVDFYCEINNAPNVDNVEIMTEGIDWTSFKNTWLQTCAWVPKRRNIKDKLQRSMIARNFSHDLNSEQYEE